jgi:Undecaprenyl-phosphate galactose phosphotransferase WbaP
MVAALATADVCAAGLAIGITVWLRAALSPSLDLGNYLDLAPLLLLFPVVLSGFGLYPGIALHPVSELALIARGVTTAFLLLTASSFLMRDVEAYSRAALLVSWPAAVVAVALCRCAARRAFGGSAWWGREAVILGSGSLAQRLAAHLRRRPGMGIRVVGLLERGDDETSGMAAGIPVIGHIADAPVLAEQMNVRYALVALPGLERDELARLIERYTASFHHVYVVPDLPGLSSLGVHAHDLGGMLGVEISHRLLFRTPQTLKRAFDVAAASAGLLAFSPFLLLTALLIRWSSNGPVFYCQTRRGRNGEVFRAWKFRTMVPDADRVLASHLASHPELRQEWDKDHKLKCDPRVTAVGRLLRKTSLDELPQLWNVLRGEMSLVGPRPIVDEEIPKYGAKYALYKKVRPGISGLWQVSGRNNTTYEERVGFDEYYVRNWSPWLDLYILGRTVKVVLTGDGAY